MTEAHWPYTRIEEHQSTSEPSWDCPEGICSCSEGEHPADGYEFSIMLCDRDGVRMRGARCRVVVNGILANPDEPFADAEGWITVAVPHEPKSVAVEWASPDTPLDAGLPHRRRYYVDLREEDREEAARRRLHNLGFSVLPTLHENTQDFQREYGYEERDGEIDTIWADLCAYHDEAMVPIRGTHDPEKPRRRFALVEDEVGAPGGGKATPQPMPASPPDKGNAKTGNAKGQGTVKPYVSPKIYMPSIVEVVKKGQHQFDWWPIQVTSPWRKAGEAWSHADTYVGTFWVFADALKGPFFDPTNNTDIMLRWPCSAAESQAVADLIEISPADLGMEGPPGSGKRKCLLMTGRLMTARWWNGHVLGRIIEPKTDNTADLLIAGCLRTHRRIEAAVAALPSPSTKVVADPAKIWIIHHRLFIPGGPPQGTKGAVNYGWHVDPSLVKPKKGDPTHGTGAGIPVNTNTAIPGTWINQDAGGQHDEHHLDYSQLLLLVAPWCKVSKPGETTMTVMSTEQVYQDKTFARLVSDNALPLQGTRQKFDPALLSPQHEKFWGEQEKLYRRKLLQKKDILDKVDPPGQSKL